MKLTVYTEHTCTHHACDQSFTNAPPMCCLLLSAWHTNMTDWFIQELSTNATRRIKTVVCSTKGFVMQLLVRFIYFLFDPMTKCSVLCLITGHRIVSGAWWSPSSPGHLRVFPSAWILQGTSHFTLSFWVIIFMLYISLTVTRWTELWFLSHGWCN